MTRRILIAEDDGDTRNIITHILSARGYQIVSAVDGQQALEKLATGPFDLMIVDLAMPNMDGLALIRELRARPETQNLPTLVLTAHDFTRDQAEAFKAGCDLFLSKPFDPFLLLEKIEQLLATKIR